MLRVGSLFFRTILVRMTQTRRCLYGVKHNPRRGIFYVRLEDDETAVLLYEADGKILDMKSINVPSEHQGRGFARLLAEAAFTYAIVNDYYLLLNCEYMQKFFLATKSEELEERVLGPKHIFEEKSSLDEGSVYELPDSEDFTVTSTKK